MVSLTFKTIRMPANRLCRSFYGRTGGVALGNTETF